MVQEVPGRLRPRIFLTFGSTRVVGRQPYAPVAFTPGEIAGTHFQGLSRHQGPWFRRGSHGKYPVTPRGIDPGTVRLVAQRLNHYATSGPLIEGINVKSPVNVPKQSHTKPSIINLFVATCFGCKYVPSSGLLQTFIRGNYIRYKFTITAETCSRKQIYNTGVVYDS